MIIYKDNYDEETLLRLWIMHFNIALRRELRRRELIKMLRQT